MNTKRSAVGKAAFLIIGEAAGYGHNRDEYFPQDNVESVLLDRIGYTGRLALKPRR